MKTRLPIIVPALLLSVLRCAGLEITLQAYPEAWSASNPLVGWDNGVQHGEAVEYFQVFNQAVHTEIASAGNVSRASSDVLFMNAGDQARLDVAASLNFRPGDMNLWAESRTFFHLDETVVATYSGTWDETSNGPAGVNNANYGLLIVDFNEVWNGGGNWQFLVSAGWNRIPTLAGGSITLDPGNYWIYTTFSIGDYAIMDDGTVTGIKGDTNLDVNGTMSIEFARVPDAISTLPVLACTLAVLYWLFPPPPSLAKHANPVRIRAERRLVDSRD